MHKKILKIDKVKSKRTILQKTIHESFTLIQKSIYLMHLSFILIYLHLSIVYEFLYIFYFCSLHISNIFEKN